VDCGLRIAECCDASQSTIHNPQSAIRNNPMKNNNKGSYIAFLLLVLCLFEPIAKVPKKIIEDLIWAIYHPK
jgi:hypothetical protein